MKTRKVLALVLALATCASVTVGCSKTSTTSSTAASGSTSGPATLPTLPNNTLSLKVSVPEFNENPAGKPVQQMWQESMEKYLGVKLDISWQYTAWADYQKNEGVLLAAGDYPDIMSTANKDYPNKYGIDGMLLDVNKYKNYMTYYQKFVDGTPGGKDAVYNKDGSMYSFQDGYVNVNNIEGAQSFTGFAYRFDLLKKNNLTPATTLDEYKTLCTKLKQLYPDAYPINNSDKNYEFYRGFVGIFHTWDTLYWNGTEWKYGPTDDNFRKMLVYINDLYKNGLIDPEFATDTSDKVKEKVLTGKDLTIPTLWAGAVNGWNKVASDKTMEWGLAYLPDGGYGTPWKWGSKLGGYTLSKNMGVVISAKTKYPEWCVKMIDYQYSDEMVDMMNWGVKDDTYKVAADGSKSFTDKVTSQDDPALYMSKYGSTSMAYSRCGIVFAPQVFEPLNLLQPLDPWWSKSEGYTKQQYWVASNKYGGKDSVAPTDRQPYYTLDADESQQKATVTNAWHTLAAEYGVKFITGELNPSNDADWNKYISVLKGAGDMDSVIKMLNQKCQSK